MSLWQDLRFAVRMLVKDRWFTLAAASALALGIGANATVFTLVNAVLLRGLPFDKPTGCLCRQQTFGGIERRYNVQQNSLERVPLQPIWKGAMLDAPLNKALRGI